MQPNQDPNLLPVGQRTASIAAQPQHITKPFPATRAAGKKYYVCSMPHASMHREDGKKIAFVHGFCETDILHDQRYLDNEIDAGNPYVREATEEEVTEAKMRRDPRGTIKEQVRSEIEAELRLQLEAEIRAEVAASASDGEKLSGADAVRQKIADAKKSGSVVKTGNATVLMTSQPAPLQGIVSTGDLAGAEAASGGQSGNI